MRKLSCRKQVQRYLLTCFFTLIFVNLSFAQEIQVSGVVTDNLNDPVIGASVVVKGTTIGTVTDFDGKYNLNVPSSAKTLVFSYIGMKAQEVAVKAGTLNVKLIDDTQEIDEVVVIGYGTAKKRDLTGSVASVGAKQLENVPVANVAEAMAGKLAGVQVTTSEGSPDAEVKIRVRGGGSISQDNSPLYIVDGFPVSSISDIAPSDIQSMDVLKDASSTAIYGSRGANGVVIITTKGAKEGKLSLSYGGNFGFKKIAKTLNVLSPYEFARAQYEQAVLQGKVSERYEKTFGLYQDIDLYKEMAGRDWQDEAYGRTGSVFTHNISLSGGTEKANFLASYSRTDDKAIMADSKYRRDNFSFKMNAKPADWFKANFTARYSDTDVVGAGANDSKAGGGEASTADSRLKHTVIYAPIDLGSLSETDDSDEDLMGQLVDPMTSIRDNYRNKQNKIYSFNGGITIIPIKNLNLRSDFGLEHRDDKDNRYYGPSTYPAKNATVQDKPLVMLTANATQRIRNTNTINYDLRNLKKAHNLGLLVGQEITVTQKTTMFQEVHNMPEMFSPEESFGFLTEGDAVALENTYQLDDKMISFFGRANYDYKGRYLATATFRADGSSKFARGNRWGYFPSAALAWRVSDEAFLASASDWLSNLKARVSYGVAGNNNIGDGRFMRNFSSSTESWMNNYDSYWGVASKVLTNKDLKWETTYTYNAGIDFGFWNNRLNGSVEVYQNNVKDLLIDYNIAGTGYAVMTANIGETRNRGVEFTLSGVIVDTKNWGLDVSFNIGHNKNQIMDLGGNNFSRSSEWTSSPEIADDFQVMVGHSVGVMYGYQTAGFYGVDDFNYVNGKWVLKNADKNTPDNSSLAGDSWGPGAIKLADLNGDGKISKEDKTIIGNAMPKAFGGFNLNARFKGFDLSAAFSFVLGNDIYNANKIEFTSSSKYYNRNMLDIVKNRFTHINWETGSRITDPELLKAANTNAQMWSPTMSSNYFLHSWAVEDGSFLRLNTLTFGYSLPKQLLKKAYIQNCRFFFTGTNLFCLTNYSGFDPEVDTRRKTPMTPGVDYSAYPKSRGYNFGVNLTF